MAYSLARLPANVSGYTGEVRAIGDVLRDQLTFMFRCGFDAYAVREDKDITDALRRSTNSRLQYQGRGR